MNELTTPAPLWRRFAAAIYDALIFIAIWAIIVQVETLGRLALGLPPHRGFLQALVFLAGLLFFGWFWTHGGQTVGMRAWRLRVRRLDGTALRWPVAAARYAAMMIWAGTLLAPLFMLLLPDAVHVANRAGIAFGATSFAVIGLIAQKLDSHRRAPNDWIAGTEVVFIPSGIGGIG